MKKPSLWLGLLWAVAASAPLAAGEALPSCYAFAQLDVAPPRPAREVIVLIDQTTPLVGDLRKQVIEQVGSLITPGTAFTIASFSAFSQGKFTNVQSAGLVEGAVPAALRPDISVNKLKRADGCLRQQAVMGRRLAVSQVGTALDGASTNLANSDVLASLKQLSARAKGSVAKDRIVVVVSDMLEHSSVTSFYEKKSLRKIDPALELQKAKAAGLTGDFGGARIYVVGGAAVPGDAYRSAEVLSRLESFWASWFAASRGKLVAFGTPSLIQPIH